MKRTWSKNQLDIFHFMENGQGNLLVNARAGTGKTTTIAESARRLDPDLTVISIAFNNHITKEMKEKVPENVRVSTLHSYGWQALRKHYGPRIVLEKDKAYRVLQPLLRKYKVPPKAHRGTGYRLSKIIDLVRMTLTPIDDEERITRLALEHDVNLTATEATLVVEALAVMLVDTTGFDFTDMIYHVVMNPKIRTPKYHVVYVDECQDLNAAQHQLLFRMMRKDARFVAVGDPMQAIYGFAGADINSFNTLATLPRTSVLPLSVCYRCSRAVVELAQEIVPSLEVSPTAVPGDVRHGTSEELAQGDWVLCRNTKPLVKLCLALIRQKRKATVKGQDYGRELISLLQRTNTESVLVAKVKLKGELLKLQRKLKAWGVPNPLTAPSYVSLLEKVEIIEEIVLDEAKSVKRGIALIKLIFTEDIKAITLSTIHKAKGFENERIFVLHPDLLPSKYATQPWQLAQERNLEYVMITRAMRELVYLTDISK